MADITPAEQIRLNLLSILNYDTAAAAKAIAFVQDSQLKYQIFGNDSNLLIVFYVQIMPDDFVMQLHRF